ncbi:MAG TPA: NPCBM/NEW2 domain-containing protein [Candidatus Hydrogenedens sp.]|nr:NPCBM/NEW2 domain-containing protein [Candidatus Hydrogenedens sp.]
MNSSKLSSNNYMFRLGLLSLIMVSLTINSFGQDNKVYLDNLNLKIVKQGWGEHPKKNLSCIGNPIKLHGRTYNRGVGTHANAVFYVYLNGTGSKFEATIGVDDETEGKGSIIARFFGDNKILYTTRILKGGEKPEKVSIDLRGITNFIISVNDAFDDISYDHVDIAEAVFTMIDGEPKLMVRPKEEPYILTPPSSPCPKINSPRITAVRPGNPFIFRIPCTGERPIQFQLEGLPEGLTVNSEGIISGTIASREPKTYNVQITAINKHGKDQNNLSIVVGDTLALTPPMGWNHWYTHYDRITADIMKQSADVMITSGMADVGYQYVSIDDCWANSENHRDPMRVGPARDENRNILPNKHFPSMKELTDYIHSKGLRAGIYTSPGPKTCANFTGTYEHEEQDAKQFAEWGFDFLKYDWCSYSSILSPKEIENLKKPYQKMGAILKNLNRDIVFNLCQYGMGEVWKWGKEVGGHCWRTAGDLGFELLQYHEVARKNASYWEYAGPGAWNDPDYILIGYSGDATVLGKPKPCPLTPSEQYSYMSLWCLMASPLFYSGDMTQLDEFTKNVLCNPEVIEINQDPAGIQGHPVLTNKELYYEIWLKPLHDGSTAIGIFNLDEIEQNISVQWAQIGLKENQKVRNLWQQKDLGTYAKDFSITIPRHGVALLRLIPQ